MGAKRPKVRGGTIEFTCNSPLPSFPCARDPSNFAVSRATLPVPRLYRRRRAGVSTGCGGFPTASHWGHEPLPAHGGSPVHSPLLHQNASAKHHNTLLHQNTRAPVGSTIIHFYSSTPEHRHNSPFSSLDWILPTSTMFR